jgi:anaerobic selenocysteine-containing dehydrogenase
MSHNDELRWGKSTVETSCPLDCPDGCSLAVSVEKGKVVKIDGSRRHPLTAGYICAKVRGFADRVYGDARLHYPAIRKGPKGHGSFQRVSWDEALGRIADRIKSVRTRSGGEAILPFSYGGSNGLLTQDTTDARLFRRLGASRLARTVCAAATGAAAQAIYGKMAGVSYEDYPEARLIVLWGANPSASSIHLVPHVRAAQRRGATLIVVDPRRTPLAKHADLHIPLRPGTDVAVALALHRHLFETGAADSAFLAAHADGVDELRARAAAWTFERAADLAGVEAEQLRRFAELYVSLSPAVIRCGWGLERNRNGGHAVMSVLALPAVAGKFGVRGGGYSMSNSGSWKHDSSTWIGEPLPPTRTVNMNRLGRALTELDDPAIELLFVYNANPVATIPDQNAVVRGLLREDLFTVVFEQVRTDTAMYADVLLPATTFLESYDLNRAYGSYVLQLGKPVIEPVGESRSNMEVFSELAARAGLGNVGETEADYETLLHVVRTMPEATREAILADGLAVAPYGDRPIQFENVFPNTPDGKIHLFPSDLATAAPEGLYSYQPDPATEIYPLALISPASGKTITSTLGELRKRTAVAYMHQDDALARGLARGDAIRIFNDLGEVHCLLEIGDGIARGTVTLPKGLWRKSTLNRSTATALAPDTLTDLGGGACFNDARVEVARIVNASWEGQEVSVFVPGGPAVH